MVFTGEHHGVVECGRAWQICVYTEQITPISWCKVLITTHSMYCARHLRTFPFVDN